MQVEELDPYYFGDIQDFSALRRQLLMDNDSIWNNEENTLLFVLMGKCSFATVPLALTYTILHGNVYELGITKKFLDTIAFVNLIIGLLFVCKVLQLRLKQYFRWS